MNMIKIFKELKHLWKLYTSAEYREKATLEEGQKVWERLDIKLPPAEGVTNQDRVRLRMFKKMVEVLPQSERVALRAWLAERTKYCHDNFSEHTVGREEEVESRQWQIYSSHLEVVMQWL